jgi:TetR/AcrR family transcriptional repressor of nem operon
LRVSNQKARPLFAAKFEQMIGMVARLFPEKSSRQARQVATGALATMMGSIVLARAAGDKRLSDDILEAGREALRSQSAVRRSSR